MSSCWHTRLQKSGRFCTDFLNPGSTDGGVASIVNPTSTILQGLIKEQRATRGSRRTVSDYIEDVAMVTPPASRSNEETASDKQRKVNTAIPSGHKQPREMGIREMDQVAIIPLRLLYHSPPC